MGLNVKGDIVVIKPEIRRLSPDQTPKTPQNKVSHTQSEHKIQSQLISWTKTPEIASKYPYFERLLFAVPNGGYRSRKTAKDLKKEGVKSGVSDLILLIPSRGFSYLCIEMKFGSNKQSETQKEFQREVAMYGGFYRVCYTFEQAKDVLVWYCENIKL